MLLKVLTFDDEPIIGEMLSRWIVGAFPTADVRSAINNQEAYAVLRGFDPDLIITDLNRPGETGLAFIDALRMDPHTRRTPILVASGNREASGVSPEELLRRGANDALEKPFTPRDLLVSLKRLLHTPDDPDKLLITLGYESQGLDYKATIDLSSKRDRAALAKDVIAMANWGGGSIVIGVQETRPGHFVPSGVSESVVEAFEVSRLNRALRPFLDPPIPIIVRRIMLDGATYVVLRVSASGHTLILAARQHEEAGLYCGRIYTRTSAAESAEVQSSAELREMLDRIRRAPQVEDK